MTGTLDRIPPGAVIGEFSDCDGLIEQLRQRAAELGLSYRLIDELAGFGENYTGKILSDTRAKQLSVSSLLAIAGVLAIRGQFVVDPAQQRRMAPLYEKRDAVKARARRRASLGPVTLKRVLPAAAAEMGRRGAASRNRKLGPETRRALARAAALARWGYVKLDADGRPTRRTHST
jgi:hypothetical protein